MAWRRRIRSVSTTIVKAIGSLLLVILLLTGLALIVVETGWANNRIRALLVRQANEYLTATLSIGRLEGSLLRGIQLGDVTLARAGRTLIHVDEIRFAYSIREIVQRGVVIREIRLTRPTIVGAKQADGSWDLGSLVKREARQEKRTGPSRPIDVQAIQIVDGRLSLRSPLDFGAAHVPTEFDSLNASFRFAYVPVRWTLAFDRVSWIGRAPDLSVTRLAGALGKSPDGWFFENLSIETPRSAFTLAGRVNRERQPAELDLRVTAPRFAFQEWSGVLRGLKDIAVYAAFDTSLKGPLTAIDTTLRLTGSGGSVKGQLSLDTTVPGWHASGAVDIERLNLARWLNRADRPSDLTGHVTLDLALELGRHFPRGVYAFNGPHAMYKNYAADAVRARGQITGTAVLVADAAAVAYGVSVTLSDGSIGLEGPFPFRFQGTATGVDLRQLPRTVPVPHVESVLALEYDVSGRFNNPFIAGRAFFGRSEFLGATIGSGATGSIDTSQQPLRYAGEGDVDGLNLLHFGEGLDVAWMRDPRFAALVSGHFHVDGSGTDRATMTLAGGGRLAHATAFKGVLSDADVSVDIADGTLRASYDGAFSNIDPAVPFDDDRFAASMTGSGRMSAIAHNLLTQETTLNDYEVGGSLVLNSSTVRSLHVERGTLDATLANSIVTIARGDITGAEIEGRGRGSMALGDEMTTTFDYELTRVDLARVRDLTGLEMSGSLMTKGRLTGPFAALRAVGDATITDIDAYDFHAPILSGIYEATAPSGDYASARGRIDVRESSFTIAGQEVEQASGWATLDARMLAFDLAVTQREGRKGRLAGRVLLRPEERSADVTDLTVTLGSPPWRIVRQTSPTTVRWTDSGFEIAPVEFVGDVRANERLAIAGNWRTDGSGALSVKATQVFLDTLSGPPERPAPYGGLADMDATIRGTRAAPRVAAKLSVTKGRVERVNYERLAGDIEYANRTLTVNLRLDQAPGIWLTAVGTVPEAFFFTSNEPEQAIAVDITSSEIDLGLLAGLTDVIQDVSGKLVVNVKAVGTNRDPHVEGTVTVSDARFLVAATRSAYKNGHAGLTFTPDRITVDSFRLEDASGRTLELSGSLGTHELRVGELEIEATARRFEIMRNEFGRIDVDASLRLRGRSETPRIAGDLTLSTGELKVDEILQRTLFQLYATEQTAITGGDAVAALNPWDRLGLDVSLHVPNTLRLTGDNIQVSPGTPIGLGDINLRVLGDLYLYKDPGQPLFVTGSFDRVVGTYTFQGRRFDVDPDSSIDFRGDLDPEVYVSVTRLISGVETRVGIYGQLRQPELRLSSAPPLDESDILSLIVFNRSTNQLSAGQQQELLVRAGTLAAGFIATPIVSAIENEIGLDILEIDPSGEFGGGPRLTIGEEIAPGLVARFSRQFGSDPYDEATVEYYLSRILRLRATFSDAQSLSARSPFRRVERAGIDLLLFFSF